MLHYNNEDGLDKVDANESTGSLKAQITGLLQAVAYLKGKSFDPNPTIK